MKSHDCRVHGTCLADLSDHLSSPYFDFMGDPISMLSLQSSRSESHRCMFWKMICYVLLNAVDYTQGELQQRLDEEKPRNHLDLRHRLDSEGKRYGKSINYKSVDQLSPLLRCTVIIHPEHQLCLVQVTSASQGAAYQAGVWAMSVRASCVCTCRLSATSRVSLHLATACAG